MSWVQLAVYPIYFALGTVLELSKSSAEIGRYDILKILSIRQNENQTKLYGSKIPIIPSTNCKPILLILLIEPLSNFFKTFSQSFIKMYTGSCRAGGGI